ncbi:MAG: hypothetical protein WA825_12150 [Steroidobacteraceae bacterium]
MAVTGGVCSIPATPASALADWTLSTPASAALTIGDPIEIGLPTDLSSSQLAGLAIEIDHIDVTAIARIASGKILYAPPQPLEAGAHELRVVEYDATGQPMTHGEWHFTEQAKNKPPTPSRGWSVKGNLGATASQRIAQSNLTAPAPPGFTLNGTFDLKAIAKMSEWTAEATLNGLYGTSNGTAAVSGQGVQPAQMQLAIKRGQSDLILGDQTLPFDNLVISGLSRRGISARLADLPLAADATAFSVRDSSLAGFYGGLGIGNSDDEVSGAVLQLHPISAAPKALTLQAGYVTGTSPGGLSTVVPYPGGNGMFPPSGTGTLGGVTNVQPGSGNAWFFGATGSIPGIATQLNAQYARSEFDFPATMGGTAQQVNDTAYSFGLNFSHPLSEKWSASVNATYQDVGTYFTSLGNPSLTPDRRSTTAQASLSGQGVSVGLVDGFTQDNTDDNPALATVRSLPRSASLSYGPTLPMSVTSWLGTPSVNLSRQDARAHNITEPSGTQPTDSDSVNGTYGLNFAYPKLSWQIGLARGDFRDYTHQQDDTRSAGPTLGATVTLGAGSFIAMNVQRLDTHDLTQDTHTRDNNYSLTGGDTFWVDRLTAAVTLTINHNTQQVLPGTLPPQPVGNAVVLKTATAQLTWHAIAATTHRGGLDVGLSCSWNESSGLNTSVLTTQGFSPLAARGLQSFLTFSTRWPLSLGDQ